MASFAADILDSQERFKKTMRGAAGEEAKQAPNPQPAQPQTNPQAHNDLAAGIKATDELLTQALKKHGITEYSAVGQKFDPTLHEAVFEYQDPSKTPGTVGVVVQGGYTIGKRILRAPKVGIVKK